MIHFLRQAPCRIESGQALLNMIQHGPQPGTIGPAPGRREVRAPIATRATRHGKGLCTRRG